MPHTTPCITWKHWSHNLNKPACIAQLDTAWYRLISDSINWYLRCTRRQMRVTTPSWFFFCFSNWNQRSKQQLTFVYITSTRRKLGLNFNHSYLWTSRSPLLFVICHVSPLLGSKPGCEISNPCFLTNFKYLQFKSGKYIKPEINP